MANGGRFSQVQTPVAVVHSNLNQEVIQVTEDKLRLILKEHVVNIEQKNSWMTPLGVLLSVVTAFSTSSFKDAFGLKAATWEAVFIITGVVSMVWLLKALYTAFDSKTIDDVVDRIKNRTPVP